MCAEFQTRKGGAIQFSGSFNQVTIRFSSITFPRIFVKDSIAIDASHFTKFFEDLTENLNWRKRTNHKVITWRNV